MSPAYSNSPNEVFSWVGIIMYLPAGQIDQQREEILRSFRKYTQIIAPIIEKYDGQVHWAKLELPEKDSAYYQSELNEIKYRLRKKFPVDEFNSYRKALDPDNILSNHMMNEILSPPL